MPAVPPTLPTDDFFRLRLAVRVEVRGEGDMFDNEIHATVHDARHIPVGNAAMPQLSGALTNELPLPKPFTRADLSGWGD